MRPYIFLLDDSLHAITTLMCSKTFNIEGVNFIPARNNVKALVEIYLDDSIYKSGVPVSDQGTFHVHD